jgi:hypothetical protein
MQVTENPGKSEKGKVWERQILCENIGRGGNKLNIIQMCNEKKGTKVGRVNILVMHETYCYKREAESVND